MRLGVSIVTVVAIVLHLMLGCQWHTAHAHEDLLHCHRTAHGHVHHHAHEAHELAHDTAQDVELPPGDGGCEAGRCVYVTQPQHELLSVGDAASDTLLDNTAPRPNDLAMVTKAVHPPQAYAAVRPHLLFQVFLI